MHAHGTALPAALQFQPTPAPAVGSVVGLGVTDALRVELRPCQIDGLVEELDEHAGPLAETYEKARRRWLEISRFANPPSSLSVEAERELSVAAYALRALAAIRAQVPAATSEPLVLVGPTDLLTTVIAGATEHAAATLVQQLGEPEPRSPRRADEIRRLGAAAQAWTDTYADSQTVEWFSFDPNWDPVNRV